MYAICASKLELVKCEIVVLLYLPKQERLNTSDTGSGGISFLSNMSDSGRDTPDNMTRMVHVGVPVQTSEDVSHQNMTTTMEEMSKAIRDHGEDTRAILENQIRAQATEQKTRVRYIITLIVLHSTCIYRNMFISYLFLSSSPHCNRNYIKLYIKRTIYR